MAKHEYICDRHNGAFCFEVKDIKDRNCDLNCNTCSDLIVIECTKKETDEEAV